MSLPKYQLIKHELLYKIKNGEFLPGDKFYTEYELKEAYNVSSITVVRALKELTDEGYLVRYQGKGTYVSKSKKSKMVRFSDIEIFSGKQESVKVVSIEKKYDKEILSELKINNNQGYYEIIRVRFVEEIPYMVHISYIPSKYINGKYPSLEYYDSIYSKFREDHGINLYDCESEEINEVSFPTPENITELLNMDSKEVTILQNKLTFLFDGNVAEYVKTYKHWKYYKIKINTLAKDL